MKIIRSNTSPGMTILLVLLTIVLAVIVIPILILVGFCWLVRFIIRGGAPGTVYLRKDPRDVGGRTGQATEQDGATETAASGDETIECEVVSARTFDENGQEIR